MLVIGLTGGIGAGKSTVAQLFHAYHIPIIDADLIAREITELNQPAFNAIVAHFGKQILLANRLDRRKLREIIFKDEIERQWLEALLHPLIIAEMQQRLKTLKAPYCIMVIPLLVETGPYPFINRILVVDASEQTQLLRVTQRDQFKEIDIKAMIEAQIKRKQRLEKAHDIILNDSTLEVLEAQVKKLHQFYLTLASH